MRRAMAAERRELAEQMRRRFDAALAEHRAALQQDMDAMKGAIAETMTRLRDEVCSLKACMSEADDTQASESDLNAFSDSDLDAFSDDETLLSDPSPRSSQTSSSEDDDACAATGNHWTPSLARRERQFRRRWSRVYRAFRVWSARENPPPHM